MACGTFALHQYYDGISKDYFKELHCDWWNSFDELKSLIDYYLSNDKERSEIASYGSKLVRETNNWESRFKKITQFINEGLVK